MNTTKTRKSPTFVSNNTLMKIALILGEHKDKLQNTQIGDIEIFLKKKLPDLVIAPSTLKNACKTVGIRYKTRQGTNAGTGKYQKQLQADVLEMVQILQGFGDVLVQANMPEPQLACMLKLSRRLDEMQARLTAPEATNGTDAK